MSEPQKIQSIISGVTQLPVISKQIPTIISSLKEPFDKFDIENSQYSLDSQVVTNAIPVLKINDLDESLLKKMFYMAKYYVVKSNNFENVQIAKNLNVWATPPANEKRLDNSFYNYPNVYLIFSVRESGLFQGFARIRAASNHSHPTVPWSLPPTMDPEVFSGIYKIDWISKVHLSFLSCGELQNPYNDDKEVKISRDGQEIEPKVGEKLCRLFQLDESIKIEKLMSDINIDKVIEEYDSRKHNRSSPRKDKIIAKSRASKSSKSSRHHTRDDKSSKYSYIPEAYYDRLVELTQMPYEEYVTAVTNGRQLNTISKLYPNPLN